LIEGDGTVFTTIVVGIDGSPYGQSALEAAIALATAFGSTLHVVAADEPLIGDDVRLARASLPPELRDVFDAHAGAHLHLDEATVKARQAGVRVESHDVRSHPTDALLDVADDVDADLIVVGSRGRGFTKRHLLGSVSTRIAQHTQRSVLIVHSEHAPPSDEGTRLVW
jgi:nucleotide-binding universal stress UspA family protein